MSEAAAGVLREQAALRRVATLVAAGEAPSTVFAAVAEEVAGLLGADAARVIHYLDDEIMLQLEGWAAPGHPPLPVGPVAISGRPLPREVRRTRRPVSIREYSDFREPAEYARSIGLRSSTAAPITVDGRIWGAMIASTCHPRTLPDDAESRVMAFTELIGMAIANADSREQVSRLAQEQAALRRVATLVARGALPEAVSEAVAREVKLLLPADYSALGRYEDRELVVIAAIGKWLPDLEVGSRVPITSARVTDAVHRTRRSARIDTYGEEPAQPHLTILSSGASSTVGTPILVEGRLWGVMLAGTTTSQIMPSDTEARLASFTELVAMAISNTDARSELAQLADEQAALRRVATMVARAVSPGEVFEMVAREIGQLLAADAAMMHRCEIAGETELVASWGCGEAHLAVGTRWGSDGVGAPAPGRANGCDQIEGYMAAERSVAASLEAAGLRSAVGAPIVVAGRLWGVLTAATAQAPPLPRDAESRIAKFAELVATAISNVETQTALVASRARVIAAADDERRRVVRDLHDGAQQRLVHAVVVLRLARQALVNGSADAGDLLQEGIVHAVTANAELRELAHGILPTVLVRGGLRAGVASLTEHMSVPVEVEVCTGRLPQSIEATAYFVISEALTNVAKHAHAKSVRVTAAIEDDTLRVSVSDDGLGGAQAVGSGLVGLSDRLAALDGKLSIESPIQGGTVLIAAIPVREGRLDRS